MGISHTTNLSEATLQLRVGNVPSDINSTLEDFDVLPSKMKINRYIFKYGWLYILIFVLLYFIETALYFTRLCYAYQFKPLACPVNLTTSFFKPIALFIYFFSNMITGQLKLITGSIQILFLLIGTILLLQTFKIWRIYVPKMLRDLIKNNRISASCGDTATCYQQFLDNYRRALSKPISYLPGGVLLIYALIYVGLLCALTYQQQIDPVVQDISTEMHLLRILSLVLFSIIGMILLYSFGAIGFTIFISGRYLRKLLQDFQVKSNPTHLDHCGGLKILGSFCLRLSFPLLAISAFFSAYDIVVIARTVSIGGDTALLYRIDFWFILLLCGVAFFLFIWASVIPLWKIHTRMIDEGEIFQQNQSVELAALQNQMQDLLDNDQLEEAKIVREKKELLETLNTSYPKWPCIIFRAVPSLLISGATLLLPPIISAVFPQLLKH